MLAKKLNLSPTCWKHRKCCSLFSSTFSPIRLKLTWTPQGVRFESWAEYKSLWSVAPGSILKWSLCKKVGLRGMCCIQMRWLNVTVHRMCYKRCYVLWSCISSENTQQYKVILKQAEFPNFIAIVEWPHYVFPDIQVYLPLYQLRLTVNNSREQEKKQARLLRPPINPFFTLVKFYSRSQGLEFIPACIGQNGRVHPTQVASLSKGDLYCNTNTIIHTNEQFRVFSPPNICELWEEMGSPGGKISKLHT